MEQIYKFYHALPPSANKIQIYSPKFTTHLLNSQTWVNPFFRPVWDATSKGTRNSALHGEVPLILEVYERVIMFWPEIFECPLGIKITISH